MKSETSRRSDTGFQQFALSEPIQRGVDAAGFAEPRPIQAATIPAALDGRDVLGLAQTGTGKTAAFVLPILERLTRRPAPGPRALIIAPTRELAAQIAADIDRLAKFVKVSSATIFGGVGQNPQVQALRRRPDIIVACPGRLLDLLEQGHVSLKAIETLVLDEADHMFDMGFLPNIRRIVGKLPAERQNLFFSATMPKEIRALADQMLRDPHVVDLAPKGAATTIEHSLYPVAQGDKIALLERMLDADDFHSGIVFTRTKFRAKRLAQKLYAMEFDAVALQGNMSQAQREKAMDGFRSDKFNILVATDIAARGLDISHVSHVINFDVPDTPDAYKHRIGRTGRAERSGKAYTFVSSDDEDNVRAIERQLGHKIERKQLEGFEPAKAEENHFERPPRQPRPVSRKKKSAAQATAPRQQQSRPAEQKPRENAANGRGPKPAGGRPRKGGGTGRPRSSGAGRPKQGARA